MGRLYALHSGGGPLRRGKPTGGRFVSAIGVAFRRAAVHAASAVLRPFWSGLGCIVVLHRVLPEAGHSSLPANRALEITPEELRALLTWVRERGMETIGLDAIPDRLKNPRGPRFVAFTFDDGYRDNLQYALPLFREFQMPFAVNVNNGFASGTQSIWWYFLEAAVAAKAHLRFSWEGRVHEFVCQSDSDRNLAVERLSELVRSLGTSRNLLLQCIADAAGVDPLAATRPLAMSWTEVGELAADPLATIGAHGACHHSLNRLTEDEIEVEVTAAKRDLATRTGREIRHFAYPFGGSNAAEEREFEIVRRAGFTTMLTTRPANLFPRNAKRLDRLPRFGISGNYSAVRSLVMIESGLSSFLQERSEKNRGAR